MKRVVDIDHLVDVVVLQHHVLVRNARRGCGKVDLVAHHAEVAVVGLVAVAQRVPVEAHGRAVAVDALDLHVGDVVAGAGVGHGGARPVGLDAEHAVFQALARGVEDQRDLALRIGAPRGTGRRGWRPGSARSCRLPGAAHGPLHDVEPVAVLDRVQAFVLGLHAAHHGVQADVARGGVGTGDPVRGAPAHIVPGQRAAQVTLLAGAEFLEVVRRGHAADVEEILVLADAARAGLVRLALGRDAVDRHFRLVHRERAQHADLRAELVHQVHVRIQAQVARAADHPVRRGGAELLRIVRAVRKVGPVLGIGPLAPQQQVAMLERVEAAALLAPFAGIHGADVVRAGFRFVLAAAGGGRVVPVHGRHVVTVGAVFRLQLPVAVERVGGRAAQHFQPVRRLVGDHVDDLARLAQELGERRHVRVQAAEQETPVVLEARHLFQVVRLLLVEALGIAGALRVLDLEQLAAVVEGPAVERTRIGGLVAALVAAQLGAAVGAGVDEGMEFALAVARDEHGLAAHVGGAVIVVVGQLAFVRQVDPVALEDVLHLQFEQGGIGKGAAVQAVSSGGGAHAFHFGRGRHRRLAVQLEVEVDLGVRCGQAPGGNAGRRVDPAHGRHQAFAAGKGKVVPQEFVAVDVDLRGQLAAAGGADEEMNVGRTVAVAAQLVEQALGAAVGRAAVAHRQDAAEPVAPFVVGNDGAAQIEIALAVVEERVAAHQVAMPHLDPGAGQRLAVLVAHRALHEQHFGAVALGAVVEAGVALALRRARHVQRAFDGARRAARQARPGFRLVGADVEEALESQARRQQAQLVALAGVGQVLQAGPEFCGLDVEVVDGLAQVADQALHDLLHPQVDGAGGLVDDPAPDQGVDVLVVHACLLLACLASGWGVCLQVAVADGGGMAAQRHHFDGHVREQRQRREQRVQRVGIGHVEDADVGVLAGDAPQVAPLAAALQVLRERALGGFQGVGLVGRHGRRQLDVHSDVEQHGSLLVLLAAQVAQQVPIGRHAQARPGRHLQHEIAVHQRRAQHLAGQQQRAEQLGAERQLGEGGKQLGRGGRAHAAFEHGAAVQRDAGQLRHRRHLRGRHQAARLGDLDGKHVGAVGAGDLVGAHGAVQRLVGHQRHRVALRQAGHGAAVVGAGGLFDQVDAARFQGGNAAHGVELGPGLVDVDPHAHRVAQRLLDCQHVGHVVLHRAGADLELEDAVAPQLQHVLGLGDIARGVAAGQGPGHGQLVAHPAAQQFAQRQAHAAGLGVKQRGFDGALGKAVALDDLAHGGHGLCHLACLHADQQRGDVGVDIDLDALRAFLAVVEAPDGGGLAPALDAVAADHVHQHQRLRAHGGHRQLVRADGRHVFNGTAPPALLRCCRRRKEFHPRRQAAVHRAAAAQPPDPAARGRAGRAADRKRFAAAAPDGGGQVFPCPCPDPAGQRGGTENHDPAGGQYRAHALARLCRVHPVRPAAADPAPLSRAVRQCRSTFSRDDHHGADPGAEGWGDRRGIRTGAQRGSEHPPHRAARGAAGGGAAGGARGGGVVRAGQAGGFADRVPDRLSQDAAPQFCRPDPGRAGRAVDRAAQGAGSARAADRHRHGGGRRRRGHRARQPAGHAPRRRGVPRHRRPARRLARDVQRAQVGPVGRAEEHAGGDLRGVRRRWPRLRARDAVGLEPPSASAPSAGGSATAAGRSCRQAARAGAGTAATGSVRCAAGRRRLDALAGASSAAEASKPRCTACRRSLLVEDHRTDRLARLHQVEAFVDALERQAVGDQVVDIELAFHVPVDNFRHVGAAAGAAERGTFPFAARHQLERPGTDFLAGRRHADDERLAPTLVGAFERLAHQLGVAHALEAVVGAAVGQLDDGVHHVFHLVRINEMRHAELARHVLALGVDVDADDLVGAHHPGSLDHVQADAAQAEHDHVGARLHLGREHHGAHARGHAATDVAHLVERRIVADFGQRDFRHHDVVREGRRAHVVEQRLAVEREAAGRVRHQSAALGRADGLAQIGLARQAEFALAAFRRVQRDHVVVFFEGFHARSHIDHDACAFVAEDGREQALRVGARQGVVIGMADAGGFQLDQHLAFAPCPPGGKRPIMAGIGAIMTGFSAPHLPSHHEVVLHQRRHHCRYRRVPGLQGRRSDRPDVRLRVCQPAPAATRQGARLRRARGFVRRGARAFRYADVARRDQGAQHPRPARQCDHRGRPPYPGGAGRERRHHRLGGCRGATHHASGFTVLGRIFPGGRRRAKRQTRHDPLGRGRAPARRLPRHRGRRGRDLRTRRPRVDVGRRDRRHRPGAGAGGRGLRARAGVGSGDGNGGVPQAPGRPVAIQRPPAERAHHAPEYPRTAELDPGQSARKTVGGTAGAKSHDERAPLYPRVPAGDGHEHPGFHRTLPLRPGHVGAGRPVAVAKSRGGARALHR
uniref:Uncharacterized protein n=1 Tax=Tanacetum cinerariifolium TaxID=118510 RepID=A0A699GE12_TANCI|nr:hypothetical protein [Tanacetum cinerariifolium]